MPEALAEDRGLMQVLVEDTRTDDLLDLIADVESLVEKHGITSIPVMKRAVESVLIRRAIKISDTKTLALDLLEIGRTTLYAKMGEYGI